MLYNIYCLLSSKRDHSATNFVKFPAGRRQDRIAINAHSIRQNV